MDITQQIAEIIMGDSAFCEHLCQYSANYDGDIEVNVYLDYNRIAIMNEDDDQELMVPPTLIAQIIERYGRDISLLHPITAAIGSVIKE
jgi:hypothetical protein